MQTQALVDTGASITCMSQEYFNKLPADCIVDQIPHPNLFQVETAGKHTVKILGIYNCRFSIPILGKVCWPIAVLNGNTAWDIFLGYDFLKAFKGSVNCNTNEVSFSKHNYTNAIEMKLNKSLYIPPYASRYLRVPVNNNFQYNCLVSSAHPVVVEGLCEVGGGSLKMLLMNNDCTAKSIKRGTFLGLAIPVADDQLFTSHEIVASIHNVSNLPRRPLSVAKQEAITANVAKSALLPSQKELLLQLLLNNHEAFADDEHDIGYTTAVPHKVVPKEYAPVYRKQFPIPAAHKEFIDKTINHLLRLRCIRRDFSSPHNSPIFAVKKPHSNELRLVQDLRQINDNLHSDFHSFMSVHDCLDRLGGLEANFVSSLDFMHAYWQLALDPESQPLTAFTVPGRGKFCWCVSPMGLKSSPSAFTRLMDYVFRDLSNTVVYLDDVLVGSHSFEEHLVHLKECLLRIRQHNLRLKITKCSFAAKEIEYLGYKISKNGIQPGEEKTTALKNFPIPSNVKAIRRFCGLANYFRQFIPNFAAYSGQLSKLTRKDSQWKGGPLPPAALQAFQHLRESLCRKPILAFPVPGLKFLLYTDASLEGGLGAILVQNQKEGAKIVACASRTLRDHEKNYSAFLLELAASVFGIESFHDYLYDTPFTLLMDHKPMESLRAVHKRTLNRLQQLMNEYTFQLQYHPGKDNILADALSRAPVHVLGRSSADLRQMQLNDSFCSAVLRALEKQVIEDASLRHYVSKILHWCHLDDGVAYICFPSHSRNLPSPSLFLTPKVLHFELLRAAHSSRFSGHGGVEKTINRLRQQYWWPSLSLDVQNFVKHCDICQACKDPPHYLKEREPLHPLPAPDMPNIRVHADLIVVPKASSAGSKYILVLTCAFSKLVELVPLPSKDAETVASAIFTRWICRYSCPREILTDRGREFCNQLAEQLFMLLGIDHTKTSAYHPQTNASCERFNREIEKILAVLLAHPDDDWEQFLPIASLTYNTSVHRASKFSPFFLTYLHDPNLPYFELHTDRPLYGTDWATSAVQRMKVAYQATKENITAAGQVNEKYYNPGTKEKEFLPNDDVWVKVDRQTLKIQNKKFGKTWWPYKVVRRLTESTYLLQKVLPGGQLGQVSTVHRNRIKPRFAPPQPVQSRLQTSAPSRNTHRVTNRETAPEEPLVLRGPNEANLPHQASSSTSSQSSSSSRVSTSSESGEDPLGNVDDSPPFHGFHTPPPAPPQGRHVRVAEALFRPRALRSNSTAPAVTAPPAVPMEYQRQPGAAPGRERQLHAFAPPQLNLQENCNDESHSRRLACGLLHQRDVASGALQQPYRGPCRTSTRRELAAFVEGQYEAHLERDVSHHPELAISLSTAFPCTT